MSYAVARMIKVNKASLTGTQRHNQRQLSDENIANSASQINKELSYLNYDLVNDGNITYSKKIDEFVKENVKGKLRKDAVLVNEWLITSDKYFFDKLEYGTEGGSRAYFETALDYFKEKFGEEKILYANVHMDEKTPHMHLGVIPFDESKQSFNSKQMFDRNGLLDVQNGLPKYMQEAGYDVERGQENSKSKHMSVLEMREHSIKKTEVEAVDKYVSAVEKEDQAESVLELARRKLKVADDTLEKAEEESEALRLENEREKKRLQQKERQLQQLELAINNQKIANEEELQDKEEAFYSNARETVKELVQETYEKIIKVDMHNTFVENVSEIYTKGFKSGKNYMQTLGTGSNTIRDDLASFVKQHKDKVIEYGGEPKAEKIITSATVRAIQRGKPENNSPSKTKSQANDLER